MSRWGAEWIADRVARVVSQAVRLGAKRMRGGFPRQAELLGFEPVERFVEHSNDAWVGVLGARHPWPPSFSGLLRVGFCINRDRNRLRFLLWREPQSAGQKAYFA